MPPGAGLGRPVAFGVTRPQIDRRAGTPRPPELTRRFEAIVFDWDGTAVRGREADAGPVRRMIERLCELGMELAVVSGTHVGDVDGKLAARPRGPGRLLLALNGGSEVFEVDDTGPTIAYRRQATVDEEPALDRAAALTVAGLAERGLRAEIVSQQLDRRKIDLVPGAEWHDPPKATIDLLLRTVEEQLASAGLGGLPEVVAFATDAAHQAGLRAARVTSDVRHVEIGLTDKSDSSRHLFRNLWSLGIAPDLVLVVGDDFGPLGRMPGDDSLMLVPESACATVVSVGVEPTGVPPGVLHLPGGPEVFESILEDQLARRMAAEVPGATRRRGWSFAVDGTGEERERAIEVLLTLSDGVVGSRAAPALEHPGANPLVLVAGAYDGEGAGAVLMPAPRWDRLPGYLASAQRVRRILDLRAGVVREEVDAPGGRLSDLRFVSRAHPGILVMRARTDRGAISADGMLAAPAGGAVTRGTGDGHEWMTIRGSRVTIGAAALERRTPDGRGVDRIAAYGPVEAAGPPAEVVERATRAAAEGFDRLLDEHRVAWAARWDVADIDIRGEDELQLAVRLSLFHLMSAAGETGESAVGARGLTGRAYRGHVFWDSDTFVLPFLAATYPPSARAMLEYRVRRLPAARARARAAGYAGAAFPWESAVDGDDVTPDSARDRAGNLVRIKTGTEEIHITAQVAWAAATYIDWSGDEEFAAGPGRELVVEAARYWASRARPGDDGRYHVCGVIGPDEYHESVDDSAFTNVMARWNLRRAADLADQFPDGVADEETGRWRELALSLADGYDPTTGLYEQFAGFFDLEPLLIAEVAPRRPITADLLLGRDRVQGAQVVKQADVLMAYHLVPEEMEGRALRANLDFYEPRTAHGSSLSPGIHAAVLARAGRLTDACEALRLAAFVDLDDLTGTTATGLHLAAMGSLWQALTFGFAGLRSRPDALTVDPRLPVAWRSLAVRVVYRGTPVRVRIEADRTRIEADRPITIDFRGVRLACDRAGIEVPTIGTRLPDERTT